jgi:hypothetical protein
VNLFSSAEKLTPGEVEKLIDFGIADNRDYDSMATLQLEGVAALYNILCDHDFAYLADEVGMGKTYQALGLAAVLWNLKPDARVVFISPRHALQQKWKRDYQNFFANNYLRQRVAQYGDLQGDDRVTSAVLGTPLHRPAFYERLSEWAMALSRRERTAVFLRHSSFRRPVYVTSAEREDMATAWEKWRSRILGWGLHGATEVMADVDPDSMSFEFNQELGRALNKKLHDLASEGLPIDLLVVDEAQCLRNPENQTNTVFKEVFDGVVGKWLFLSATPVHGSPDDVRNVLNHYPSSAKEAISDEDSRSMASLQHRLRDFMVRRPRRYVVGQEVDPAITVGKTQYRNHDRDGWAVDDLDAMSTLSMALVQKTLVKILAGRRNRYRIGFLSSFETLQDSVRHMEDSPLEDGEGPEPEWFHDQNDRTRGREAPDAGELARLGMEFETKFGRQLPHPKLDWVAAQAARRAFGTDSSPGGEKFLIFTRRVSTVRALKQRLNELHHKTVEDRVRRVWGESLDWDAGTVSDVDDPLDEADDDIDESWDDRSTPFRRAMAKGGWLFRFGRSFRRTGGNALFFEENWLARFCKSGNVEPSRAANDIPLELWAESLAHARRKAGKRTAIHRARRLQYLSVHTPKRCPKVFGMTDDEGNAWHEMLAHIFPDAAYAVSTDARSEEIERGGEAIRDAGLVEERTLWSGWNQAFAKPPLAEQGLQLPGGERLPDLSSLARRQVLKAIIEQTLRLTDTVVDLYYASKREPTFVDAFLEYVVSKDPAAQRLRRVCSDWMKHLDLIVRNTFSSSIGPLEEMAKLAAFSELNKQSPVLGVTGSSRGHKTALSQFRMPGYPLVLVCTDTLKEGVDLHLFCDQVVHYGVAWTSGDLEQRIGRVDRFFSQIERKLRHAGDGAIPQLGVYYPHVVKSLERRQVEFVIGRKRQAEELMDTCLALEEEESTEIQADYAGTEGSEIRSAPIDEPFGSPRFLEQSASLELETPLALQEHVACYSHFSRELRRGLNQTGFATSADSGPFHRGFKWGHGETLSGEALWSYDSDLRRYIVSLSRAPEIAAPFLPGSRRYQLGREMRSELIWQLAVPKRGEPQDDVVGALVAMLKNASVVDATDAQWEEAKRISGALGNEIRRERLGGFSVRVALGARGQRIKIRLGRHLVRVTSQIARLEDLPRSDRWGGDAEPRRLTDWAAEETNKLAAGFLVLDDDWGLHFGMQLIIGHWAAEDYQQLFLTVAQRADDYEAALVGKDVF